MPTNPNRPEFQKNPKRPGVAGKLMPRYTSAKPIRKTPGGIIFGWLVVLFRAIGRGLRPLGKFLARHPWYAGLLAVLATLLIAWVFWLNFLQNSGSQTSTKSAEDDSTFVGSSLSKGDPPFETITPPDSSIEAGGGWTRISPPSRDPVYAYTDSIGQIPIIVSQQPLPKNLREDTEDKIQELALEYAANDELKVDGRTVYIGTSNKGPQSVIFTKNDLLILIKSDSAISNKAWEEYISSLR